MTKPLTNNEIMVLQENFDLFGAPQHDLPAKASKPGARAKLKTSVKNSAPKRAHQKAVSRQPATADILASLKGDEPTLIERTTIEHITTERTTTPSPLSVKYLAVRAASGTAAKDFLESRNARVIDYALEKRDPALRNISESLLDLGMEYWINDQTIHWVLIEDSLTSEEHQANDRIEIAFYADWFAAEKKRIRQLRGAAYLDACSLVAQKLR